MPGITLKSLIGPRKDAAPVIAELLVATDEPLAIEDAEGRLLLGAPIDRPAERIPITQAGTVLGWVSGNRQAAAIAGLLSHLAEKEAEKKTLGGEVLHLYREINLIYNFTENLAALLELRSVAEISLNQARQLITASGGGVLLLNESTDRLELLASFGSPTPAATIELGEGIVGAIARQGNAEIVNDVAEDARASGETSGLSSLICAPLKINDRVRGAIVMANETPVTYTAGDLKLLNTLALQAASAVENAILYERMVEAAKDREQLSALHKELEVASGIQQSLVPRTFPPFPERPEFEIHAGMTPAKEVGGDFFDFFLIDEENLGFVIGDVSGKGVPAALFMAVSRTLFKATARDSLRPEQCIEQVNRILALDSPSHMFVTGFYGIFNTRTGVVSYCNAGHNPPYIMRRDGRVEPTEMTGGLVLGMRPRTVYRSKQIQLDPGDALFLYTDGVTEAMDAERNEFEEHRLEESLSRHLPRRGEEIVQGVVDDVKAFVGEAPQADDLTIMLLRRLA